MTKRNIPFIVIGIAFVVLFAFWSSITLKINSGQAGVLYKQFSGGTVVDEKPLSEGFHFIAPWNKVIIYSVQTQERKESMKVLSKNGLNISVDVSIRYKAESDNLGKLHQQIGVDYLSKIIIPEVRSSTRKVVGKYDPEELYSTKKDIIQKEIFEEAKTNVKRKFIDLDAVLIRDIELPQTIQAAIENKLKQEQSSKEYEFILQKETKEAERKRIEAKGIKDFQDIVSQGLSSSYLRWKGIETTLELAKSENSKVIVIGGGKDGLPIILNEK